MMLQEMWLVHRHGERAKYLIVKSYCDRSQEGSCWEGEKGPDPGSTTAKLNLSRISSSQNKMVSQVSV